MNSYIEPLRSELEKRARLSQEIYRRLQAALAADSKDEEVIERKIDTYWLFSVENCQTGPSVHPTVFTDYGVSVQEPINIALFRKQWMDPALEADIEPVFSIYVGENATLIVSGAVESPDETATRCMYRELSAEQLEGLSNDIDRWFA